VSKKQPALEPGQAVGSAAGRSTAVGVAFERQAISLRLKSGLRDRVWGVALREGKSLNEMVNDLLERGLDADRIKELIAGSVAGFAVARALLAAAEAAVVKYKADGGLWLYDVENFDRAVVAINRVLETLRPVQEVQDAIFTVEAERRRHVQSGGSHG
jgi:hypothetical protein